MKWNRKEKLKFFEQRNKPTKKIMVNINKEKDPKDHFFQLPIMLSWYKPDEAPVLIVLSPHPKYDDTCDIYDYALRRELHYVWSTTERSILRDIEDESLKEIRNMHLHAIIFDSEKVTMSTLMAKLPYFHYIAEKEFLDNQRRQRETRKNLRAWASFRWTTTRGTSSGVIPGFVNVTYNYDATTWAALS